MAAPAVERRRFHVRGILQGVGFRPLVYRLALEAELRGFVRNQLGEVLIEVEGASEPIERFRDRLQQEVRLPARIDHLDEEHLSPVGDGAFVIAASGLAGASAPIFPPDLAICPACQADLLNPAGRFHDYAFTSCTYCGPRFSMIEALPYDRPTTTMAPFPLCPACRAEYTDPCNRRFHAQSLACPTCGPRIELRGPDVGDWRRGIHALLQAGGIAAVKGIGGFHLLCDAMNEATVLELRRRKRRPQKPFALMARDLDVVDASFELSSLEREVLTSPRAPILLLRPKPGLRLPVDLLAPGCNRLGVMLPYSPLHLLLFPAGLEYLVATSGNQSGRPIARTNAEALTQLAGIADRFLLHDRSIAVRVEDSVCQVVGERVRPIRRSRGYVPESIRVPLPPGGAPVILGAGAEQKNTFCLLQGDEAILSPHLGDLDGEAHLACWRDGLAHQVGLLGAEPGIIAYDPHPGYQLTQEIRRYFAERRLEPVFHHHAHMAATTAEHGLSEPVIGCILDGTGFGPDGALWGFEILAGGYLGFERISHLAPITLPGGEAAIRQPWLVAVSLYYGLVRDTGRTLDWAVERFGAQREQMGVLLAQLDGRIPAPKASSAGRLFDGVAALLGLCERATYEGEPAIRLAELAEAYAGTEPIDPYPVAGAGGLLSTAPLIESVLHDLERSAPAGLIARRFHRSVAEMVLRGALHARLRTGLQQVVLGGGVWQNRLLLSLTEQVLVQNGFQVYAPERLPAGDGGIALGQAVIAQWRWHQHVSSGSSAGD